MASSPPGVCIRKCSPPGSRRAPNLGCSCLPPAGRCRAGELETSDPVTVVLGQDAKLPCFYRGEPGEQVGQVAWARVDAGEGARELALLHSKYGLHVSAAYEGRVEQPPPPRSPLDGAVLLRNAVQADEGEYECRVSTFPAGSFQTRLRLRVLGKWGAGRTGPPGPRPRLRRREQGWGAPRGVGQRASGSKRWGPVGVREPGAVHPPTQSRNSLPVTSAACHAHSGQPGGRVPVIEHSSVDLHHPPRSLSSSEARWHRLILSSAASLSKS